MRDSKETSKLKSKFASPYIAGKKSYSSRFSVKNNYNQGVFSRKKNTFTWRTTDKQEIIRQQTE